MTTTKTGTLAELNVGLGDVVQNTHSGHEYEIRGREPGVLALYSVSTNHYLIDVAESTDTYTIARATPDNTDILNNTEAFGLMSEDKQRRMKKWPHGWVSWTNGGWCNSPFPTWGPVCVYRAKPAPVRITGTVQLGADGKPDFSTWEASE